MRKRRQEENGKLSSTWVPNPTKAERVVYAATNNNSVKRIQTSRKYLKYPFPRCSQIPPPNRTPTLTFLSYIYAESNSLSLSSLLSRSINPSCLFPFSSVSLSQFPSFSRDREFHTISRKFHLLLFSNF